MSLVRGVLRKYIFSEKAPQTISQNASAKESVDMDKINKAIQILKSINVVEEEVVDEIEMPIEPLVKKIDGMQFISSKDYELPEDSMPKYAEAMKKLQKRKKSVRDPYKANIVRCDSCGKDFDFNKEYPAGQLESGENAKAKCNKCRAK